MNIEVIAAVEGCIAFGILQSKIRSFNLRRVILLVVLYYTAVNQSLLGDPDVFPVYF